MAAKAKTENPLLSLMLNVVVPVVVLTALSGEDRLGPAGALLTALAFPVAYGAYDLIRRKNFNLLSIVGVVGVLLTGGIGLLELDPQWIAVKEAGVPLVIGAAVVGSLWTRFPLVRTIMRQVIDFERVTSALEDRDARDAFERRLAYTTYMLGGSFLLSAVLNYVLARLIVVSPAGTAAFNQELGRMTALSLPVIAAPLAILLALAVLFLVSGIRKQTGLDVVDILRDSGRRGGGAETSASRGRGSE